MAGIWPNLDAGDMEARVRTLLNVVAADTFFTQPQIFRWLSLGVKDVAQKSLCVRRILDAATVASAREFSVNAYKTHYVEYLPATGRPRMLDGITPLQVGNFDIPGVEPRYSYEYGEKVGIDPLPGAVYRLRLYVSDMAKVCHTTYPIADFSSGWTEKVGHAFWTIGASLVFTGTALNDENDVEGIALTASTNYTFTFTVSNLADAELTVKAGTTAGPAITANGIHTVTLVSSTGTPKLTFTGKDLKTAGGGTVTVDDLYVLKEADLTDAGDQTELAPAWQFLVILYALAKALKKDKKPAAALLIEGIYANEIEYLRQHIVENIPDGKNSVKQQ